MPPDANKFSGLIFIVEDNRIYAEMLQAFLKNRFPAATVEVFSEGEPMLAHLYKKPRFIILDYYLDGNNRDAANGLTMIKEIKSKDEEVRVFTLSAQQDISVALAVKKAGCLYLVKNSEAFNNLEELIIKDLL